MLELKSEKNYRQGFNPMLSDDNNQDNFKFGIILLSVFIVVLLIIGAVYLFRSKRGLVEDKTEDGTKVTLVDQILGTTNNQPTNVEDTDNDGLSDKAELEAKTDLSKVDTDNDGLSDREEIMVYKTDPLKADTDNDGVVDGQEIKDRHDPLNPDPNALWPPLPSDISSNK